MSVFVAVFLFLLILIAEWMRVSIEQTWRHNGYFKASAHLLAVDKNFDFEEAFQL